uniref:Cytochrome b6-f complex subunit 6 n=1 Tax=Nitellopsis obtusa TaxID=40811 RepID=A0A8F6YEY0_9VIRI|nr:cytochrome b6/f complex subunit VI [Nitellopsis obtusa]
MFTVISYLSLLFISFIFALTLFILLNKIELI